MEDGVRSTVAGKLNISCVVVNYRLAYDCCLLQSLLNVPETKVTTLPNGMKVATEDSGGSTCTVSPVFMDNARLLSDGGWMMDMIVSSLYSTQTL